MNATALTELALAERDWDAQPAPGEAVYAQDFLRMALRKLLRRLIMPNAHVLQQHYTASPLALALDVAPREIVWGKVLVALKRWCCCATVQCSLWAVVGSGLVLQPSKAKQP